MKKNLQKNTFILYAHIYILYISLTFQLLNPISKENH